VTRLGLIVLAVVVIFSVGCRSGEVELRAVRGHVTSVEAASLLEIKLLTVVDEGGKTWEFTADRVLEFTPSHLREHMALGQPVVVTYREVRGRLVAEGLSD